MDEPTCKRCTKCGEMKPLAEFHRAAGGLYGHTSQCKTCKRDYQQANLEAGREAVRRYREKNPEAVLERARQYRQANPERVRESQRRYREANRETVLERHREQMRQYRAANPGKSREQRRRYVRNNPETARQSMQRWSEANREYLRRYRQDKFAAAQAQVLAYYSPFSPPRCACPGCQVTENLSIDHIDSDGADHREKNPGPLCFWLIKQGFPSGYQVLCKSCNSSKGRGEHCILDH